MKTNDNRTSISARPECTRDWNIAKAILLQTATQLSMNALYNREVNTDKNDIYFTEKYTFPMYIRELIVDIKSSFSKNEIKYIMGFVGDGHIMVQSCSKSKKTYTGNRDYDYLTQDEINNLDENFRQIVSDSIENLILWELFSEDDVYQNSRISLMNEKQRKAHAKRKRKEQHRA